MATMHPTINDTMTTAQMRQIREKLTEERMMRSGRSSTGLNDSNLQLQQAILKRQELMEKIRHEKGLREDLMRRPASYATRRKSKSPPVSPRRAESQPPPPRYNHHESQPRQVVEHQFRPMRLDPLDQAPKPPQIIQASPVQAPVQAPYVVNVPQPNVMAGPPANTKAEMMEMMMLQNAQMHQMIMNQMMMQAIPKPAQDNSRSSRVVDADDLRRRPPSVHHHHYDTPSRLAAPAPAPQPATHQPVYTLPPVVGQPMGYPMYQQSPRYYPAELEPLRQPKDESFLHRAYGKIHGRTNRRRPPSAESDM